MLYVIITLGVILVSWTLLTLYVEHKGPPKQWSVGNAKNDHEALIVFDPDPFYNLDEKVCLSFANALAERNVLVTIMTVAAAEESTDKSYDLYVYCANTYNWRPDRSIVGYIRANSQSHKDKPVVAITLGAGSTGTSQKILEKIIAQSGGTIQSSHSLWLWRPNDDTKSKEDNVSVAVEMAYGWGTKTSLQLK